MVNLIFKIIARSGNKVIGKTYRKSVVLSRVLSATAVMVWTREEVGGCSEWRTGSGDRYWGNGIHACRSAAG